MGERYYDESDVRKILGYDDSSRKTVVYCRVSSHSQKDDLRSQEDATRRFCLGGGIAVDEWVSEIGSGLNFNLMGRISRGEIQQLIIAHKDRSSVRNI